MYTQSYILSPAAVYALLLISQVLATCAYLYLQSVSIALVTLYLQFVSIALYTLSFIISAYFIYYEHATLCTSFYFIWRFRSVFYVCHFIYNQQYF